MLIKVPKAEELSPKPITDGVYKAVLTTKMGQTKDSALMVIVTANITSQGPNPNEKTIGRKVFENLPIMESTLWKVNMFVKAAAGRDLPEGDITEDELAALVTSAVGNKEVLVTLNTTTGLDGSPRNGIKAVKSLTT